MRRVKRWQATLAILTALFASIALADDFKTVNGKEYKNVTVSRVEPDGIVLRSKSGISKIYFTELPKEVQERFHYNPAGAAAQSPGESANVTATSGIDGLPPITIELKDEILNALKMTDKLDALYKGGCSSAEFVAAAVPVESVFVKSQGKLPKGDPRRDLFANTFDAYQNALLMMKANEQGKGERPDATIVAAGLRKHLLTKILQGNMTPEEKTAYYAWRKGLEASR
jgi:hypothetical protein